MLLHILMIKKIVEIVVILLSRKNKLSYLEKMMAIHANIICTIHDTVMHIA